MIFRINYLGVGCLEVLMASVNNVISNATQCKGMHYHYT
jgi:hypothetical protein